MWRRSSPLREQTTRILSSISSLPRLRNNIHERRFAGTHSRQSALKGWSKLIRVSYRTLSEQAVTLCDFRVVDIRIVERRPDVCAIGSTSTLRAHALDNHDFRLISAVVMHKEQKRNLVVSRRPKRTRPKIQIAVADDPNGEPTSPLVGQRDADRSLRVVADTESTTVTPVTVMLIEIQEHALPVTRELVSRTDAPVVVLDLGTQLTNHALDADRT